MLSDRNAEIIGGGIAGLTAATALAQAGWRVRLHERDPEIRAIGAGIYVWGNGLCVLEALGLYDQAVTGAHVGPVLESRDHRNRTVERIPINGPGQPRVYTILRDRLINTLVEGAERAGVDIVTGSEVQLATPDGSVTTASGTSLKADLIVAADGVNSKIRDRYELVRSRRRMHQGTTRLTIPREPGFVSSEDENKYIEYFNGRRRVLYTPSSARELYVALVTHDRDRVGRRVPIDVDTWVRAFPQLEKMLTAARDIPARWDTFEFLALTQWSVGRIALLGDAAHAQPPYLGQGGGCAMMNALGLARAVSVPDRAIEASLATWEESERPTIEHTQRWSYGLGILNLIPDVPRSALLSASGRVHGIGRSRLRAATTVPARFIP